MADTGSLERILGSTVVERGWVPAERLNSALATRPAGKTLADHLVEIGALTPAQKEGLLSLLETEISPPGYQILSALGRGSMGVVFKASDAKGRMVAIKVLPPDRAGDPAARERFLEESRILEKLSHPGIVKLLGAGEHQGASFIITEYVEGPSFARAIARRAFLCRDVAFILAAVGRALEHAHERGVIHADIAPRNILLKSDGKPKLADFGLARSSRESAQGVRGMTAGTPVYMSPELAAAKPLDGRSDVYSLGAVLYEAVTGRPPFWGSGINDILDKVARAAPVPPRFLDPQVPPELEGVILRALEKDREKRQSTMRDFADELEAWALVAPDWFSMVP